MSNIDTKVLAIYKYSVCSHTKRSLYHLPQWNL